MRVAAAGDAVSMSCGAANVSICAAPDALFITPMPMPRLFSPKNSFIISTPPSHRKLCIYPFMARSIHRATAPACDAAVPSVMRSIVITLITKELPAPIITEMRPPSRSAAPPFTIFPTA